MAEISCQSGARTQSKGAVANGVLASPCDVQLVAYDCVYPQYCQAAQTETPDTGFFGGEGCKTGLRK